MQLIGTIIAVLPERSGVSQKSGKEWRTQEFVVRDDTQKFPETYVFEVFNKDIGAQVGDSVEVHFDGDAHEYNGRWYNSLRAYKITLLHAQEPVQTSTGYAPKQEEEGQLPF